MAKKTKTSGTAHTRNRAKAVASAGKDIRNRVRKLSVDAFRDRSVSLHDVRSFVHDVLEGAVEGVDKSIPASSRNVLREVFDGLSEGVHAITTAGSTTIRAARERGREVATKNAPAATKRISAANDEFLGAVRSFADKTSRQVREELDALVARTERTAPKVTDSARKAARAADGRLVELSEETARAGIRVARRAAGAIAMGASGLLEGMAESLSPKDQSRSTKNPAKAARATSTKKPVKPASKKRATPRRRNG